MQFSRLLIVLGTAGILAGCGTSLPVHADGCGCAADGKFVTAEDMLDSGAAPIYYSFDNSDDGNKSSDYVGTPGYYAVNGLLAPEQPSNSRGKVSLDTPRRIAPSGTYQYMIESGDSVYALAKKNCVSIQDIKAVNGINSKFEIRAGDTINLPIGRCKA